MPEFLEAGFAKSPLPCTVARRRWRLLGVTFRIIRTFSLARETVVESSATSSIPTIKRLRLACLVLRSIRAFSLAADALPENQNKLLHEILECSSPSHIAIDIVGLDCLSNLVRSRSTEQLRQFGGVERVASALGSNTENGLCGDEEGLAQRQRIYGSNRIQKPHLPVLQIVLDTIREPIIIILLLCAVLSLVFGITKHGLKGWSDGGSIFSAVFVVIAVTAYCDIWARTQILKLSIGSDEFTIDVIRNGQESHIPVFDAVVGDVICLKLGDQVPADGLYICGNSLEVGEPNMIEQMGAKLKDTNDPFLLAGSKVVKGSARMLVTAVGMIASRGQNLRADCHDAYQDTPLQMKLHKLAMLIARVGRVAASLALIVLLIRYFTGHMRDKYGKPEFLAGKTSINDVCSAVIGILATPVAIASAAIPDCLLLAVTMPVAYSSYRMAAEQKALVRNPSAWEGIGSTTVICINERGNLTTHKLKVSRFWCGQDTSIAPSVRELLHQGGVSDSTQVSPEQAVQERVRQMILDVERGRAGCAIPHPEGDPEVMLANCSKYYDEHGQIKDITDDMRENLEQKILELKSKCLECIAWSCTNVSNEDGTENFHPMHTEECCTLLGFAGLTYHCPPEIKEAVVDCQRAGVNIKLVTKSELSVARAIAFECGILDPNQDATTEEVVEGIDFQNYPEGERLAKADKIRVMARASTFNSLQLVKDLKQKGHVVAVTGDSTGDADVLKEADIGLSLGIQGTKIAKQNSDIIIMNDDFDSIATALRWGRGMHYKIQIYTQFQLTFSMVSLVIDFVTAISAREPPTIKIVAAISAGKVPFAAFQVLWIKLIVGALAALAITIEEPAEKLQQVPSVDKTKPFITNIMWRKIVGQALYPIITLLTIHFKGESVFNLDTKVKETIIFNILVLWQLFTIFTMKRFELNIIKGIQREKLFWTIFGTTFSLQVVIIEVLKRFAGTEGLNLMQWAACIVLALLAWPVGWIAERINVPRCLSSAQAFLNL